MRCGKCAAEISRTYYHGAEALVYTEKLTDLRVKIFYVIAYPC